MLQEPDWFGHYGRRPSRSCTRSVKAHRKNDDLGGSRSNVPSAEKVRELFSVIHEDVGGSFGVCQAFQRSVGGISTGPPALLRKRWNLRHELLELLLKIWSTADYVVVAEILLLWENCGRTGECACWRKTLLLLRGVHYRSGGGSQGSISVLF